MVEKKHSAKYFKEMLVQRHFFLLCVQWGEIGIRIKGLWDQREKGKRQNAKRQKAEEAEREQQVKEMETKGIDLRPERSLFPCVAKCLWLFWLCSLYNAGYASVWMCQFGRAQGVAGSSERVTIGRPSFYNRQ